MVLLSYSNSIGYIAELLTLIAWVLIFLAYPPAPLPLLF